MKTNKTIEIKKLHHIHQSSRMHWVGDGFPVRSVFDYNGLGQELSPFLLLDYASPYEFSPSNERGGVGAHPHKGFETVTIAYQGELEHRDSSGGGGKIGPGDVQWMTAGGGIIHEEMHSADFTHKGGPFQMVQLWVNLPAKHKTAKPGYQTLLKAQIPQVSLPNNAGAVRVIAGKYEESSFAKAMEDNRVSPKLTTQAVEGPAKTFTPINLWDVQFLAGKAAELSLPDGHTTALLVMKGGLTVNDENEAVEGDLVIFRKAGEQIQLQAKEDSHLLVLSGEPIEEPIVGRGPFVMNTRKEIEQAYKDYEMGKMGKLS
jgi:quercetin 2,3-dioxygenase